jgi:hypothetical protein
MPALRIVVPIDSRRHQRFGSFGVVNMQRMSYAGLHGIGNRLIDDVIA